jgi:hypothetical protein
MDWEDPSNNQDKSPI